MQLSCHVRHANAPSLAVSLFLSLVLLSLHVGVLGHSEKAWCYLQELIGRNVFYAGIKRHLHWSDNACRNSLGGRAHIVELLCLADVHLQVTGALVDSNTVKSGRGSEIELENSRKDQLVHTRIVLTSFPCIRLHLV